jgi:hypothetical protein
MVGWAARPLTDGRTAWLALHAAARPEDAVILGRHTDEQERRR